MKVTKPSPLDLLGVAVPNIWNDLPDLVKAVKDKTTRRKFERKAYRSVSVSDNVRLQIKLRSAKFR